MPRQLGLDLPFSQEVLRAAFDRCPWEVRRLGFEQVMANEPARKCLEAMARGANQQRMKKRRWG